MSTFRFVINTIIAYIIIHLFCGECALGGKRRDADEYCFKPGPIEAAVEPRARKREPKKRLLPAMADLETFAFGKPDLKKNPKLK